jgi:hypothetical protein
MPSGSGCPRTSPSILTTRLAGGAMAPSGARANGTRPCSIGCIQTPLPARGCKEGCAVSLPALYTPSTRIYGGAARQAGAQHHAAARALCGASALAVIALTVAVHTRVAVSSLVAPPGVRGASGTSGPRGARGASGARGACAAPSAAACVARSAAYATISIPNHFSHRVYGPCRHCAFCGLLAASCAACGCLYHICAFCEATARLVVQV